MCLNLRFILGLQFKASSSKKYALYSFKIADKARKACSSLIYSGKVRPRCLNQHIVMLILAIALKVTYGYNPPPVFYALPLIYDINELEANMTNLLNRTRFINITTFPPMTFIDCQTHKIKINERTGQTTVRSNPTLIPITLKSSLENMKQISNYFSILTINR